MKYERQKINPGAFADILPDGAELYVHPEMPSIEFKRNGIKYSMTDFRLLHTPGVEAFGMCLNTMINDPDARECSIQCNDLDDDTIKIITDIVTGFHYSAKKGGKHGFSIDSNGPVHGSMVEKHGNGDPAVLTFYIADDFARYAYECCRSRDDAQISLCDIVSYVSERTWRDIEKEMILHGES